MRRATAAAFTALALTLALTGCSSSSSTSAALAVTIRGDKVRPNGERVEVPAGKPIRLKVDSDRAAELHVHSSPEQELEVEKGRHTLTFTVKTPGIVDVEEHESNTVLFQLVVR